MASIYDLGTLRADVLANVSQFDAPIERSRSTMRKFAGSVETDLNRIDGAFSRNQAKVNAYSKGFGRNARGIAGNVGFQVQDIAVQLQQGTDAMRVFVQQGSQIAGAFGPTGAVVGAILAVGGAVAGALVPSMFKAEDQSKRLAFANDALKATFDDVDSSTLTLTDTILDLAKANEQAAKSAFASAITAAMIQQIDTVERLSGAIEDLRLKLLFAANQNVELATGTGIIVKGFKEISNNADELAERYGITAGEAEKLGRIANRFIKLGTPEAARDLSAQLDILNTKYVESALAGGKANGATVTQISNLSQLTSEVSQSAAELEKQQKLLKLSSDLNKSFLEIAGKGSKKERDARDKLTSSILSQIEALERSVIKERDGEQAAFKAAIGYEKLNATLKSRIDAAFAVKEAIAAQEESEKMLMKSVEDSAKAYVKQIEFQRKRNDAISARRDELINGLKTETQLIKEEYKRRYNEILYLTGENLELRNDLIADLNKEFNDRMNRDAAEATKKMGTTFQSGLKQFLLDPTENGLKRMVDMFANAMADIAAEIAAKQIFGAIGGGNGGWLDAIFAAGGSALAGSGSGAAGSSPDFVGLPSPAASGRSAQSGKTVVINQHFSGVQNSQDIKRSASQAAAQAAKAVRRGERNL